MLSNTIKNSTRFKISDKSGNSVFNKFAFQEFYQAEKGTHPAYSPDLNKIENWWFVLKNWMKQRWDEGQFKSEVQQVLMAFTDCQPEDEKNVE
jgi:hypothetical protein